MTDSYSGLHDPYTDQLAAARYSAERDQARQELERERHRRKLAESAAVERETVRAEDHEAAAWVREHGGLEEVRRMFQDADSRRVELCGALGIDLDKGWSEAMAAMRLRLVPEGMEWPRFEDGKPVRFSDEVELFSRHGVVNGVELMSATFVLKDTRDGTILQAAHGERVRRPAPKVLDADGVEIRVGDTVWWTRNYTGTFRVESITLSGKCAIRDDDPDEPCGMTVPPEQLTHRAPVLAADGEPLEVGQTVYAKNYGYVKCTVLAIEWVVDGYLVEVENEGGHKFRQTPDEFTHQRHVPDADGNRIEPAMDVWWICEGDEHGVHAEKLHVESIDSDGDVECSPYNGGTSVCLDSAELYVNKPVLDADGVPIHEGDVLYSVETGDYVIVDSIEPGNPWFAKADGALQHCAEFTHRAPVLAADGRPLREGDTVWSVDSGTRYTVEKVTDELIPIKCRSEMGSTVSLHPSQLTHERPDSWERLEEDANSLAEAETNGRGSYNAANDYCNAHGLEGGSVWVLMARDIVRRAKALAERDA